MEYTLSKLSQCTSIVRRFGLLLRPSSGSVIQNSTAQYTHSSTCQSRSNSVAESAVKVVITGWGTPAMDSKLAHSVMVGW